MNYHNITKDDEVNGDGLRVVLWTAGCSHHCAECQNPQTWDKDGGIKFDDAAKAELFEALEKPWISGVTFSGGDPMFIPNRNEIIALAKEIKEKYPNKTIWMYSGYTINELIDEEVPLDDIDVLVDGKYMKDLRDVNLHWRGSGNQRVIDVQESLQAKKIVLHCEDGPEVPLDIPELQFPKIEYPDLDL